MSAMSTGVESGGRTRQKQRTRESLIAAARMLVEEGATPTVEDVAERAGISRTTAYRYFPNQRTLLVAAHPETATTTLLTDDLSSDPQERLDAVATRFIQLIIDTEAAQRTMLRLSLDPEPQQRGRLPLRQGRAIAWITEALQPLSGRLTDEQIHRLALAVRSAIGVEALVWLTDIGGLSREEAAETMRWSAQALLSAAVVSGPPPTKSSRRPTRRRTTGTSTTS
jgi:AcrR family transcriptional regulator